MTREEFLEKYADLNLHPYTVSLVMKQDGSFGEIHHDEWVEDFGLGYVNKCAWEGQHQKDRLMTLHDLSQKTPDEQMDILMNVLGDKWILLENVIVQYSHDAGCI